MAIVKIKTKYQVTIPTVIREKAGVDIGDVLEAKVEQGGTIILTPKILVDKRLAEGLKDIRAGRTYGPFETADEMIASLKRNMKERAKAKKAKRS